MPGSRVLSRTAFLPNPRLLVRGGGHKSDLLHLRQSFLAAEVPVVFDHLAVGVANRASPRRIRWEGNKTQWFDQSIAILTKS